MDRKLIEFKSLFFNSSDFTLNMKKDIWKEKYLLFAKRAKKIDSKYSLKQYFFDSNDEIIKLIDSVNTKSNEAIIAEIDKQAIKSVLQNYFKYEKGMQEVPNNIDDLQELYTKSLVTDKQQIDKKLDDEFKIEIKNNNLEQFINDSDIKIKNSINPDKIKFDGLLKKYNIQLNPTEIQQIENKINNFR